MGSIYKAEQTSLHRIVALKILPRKLAARQDVQERFFREAEAKFRPVECLREGVYICGLAHSPGGMAETIAQAQAAAQRAATLLSRDRLVSGRTISRVSERRCSGCELCIPACPYGARVKDEEKGVAAVIEALCLGCGACTAVCPNGAAELRGFTDSQVFSMVDAAI